MCSLYIFILYSVMCLHFSLSNLVLCLADMIHSGDAHCWIFTFLFGLLPFFIGKAQLKALI